MIELIKQAKLEYETDTSWSYKFENQFYVIDFWQDEKGTNHVEQYLHNHNGVWVDMIPTDEELSLMYKILNDTPYRSGEVNAPEWMLDNDTNNGVYNQFN